MAKRIYFDWAATALPFTGAEASPFFGNPSSTHAEGRSARLALEDARERCAITLGVKAEQLYFTSGGTESNAIVLFSLLCSANRLYKDRILKTGSRSKQLDVSNPALLLYSAAEHASIRENAIALNQLGIPCNSIGIESDGRVSKEKLEKAIKKNPGIAMAAIMAVNNETGAINHLKTLTALIRGLEKRPIHIHCDAVQAAGKIPMELKDWGIDSAAISAHKIGGQKGSGLLWLKKPINVLYRGGAQEKKIRPGTENINAALDMALALERHLPSFYNEAADRMKALFIALQKTNLFIPIPAERREEDSRFSPWILQCAFRNRAGKIIPGEVMVRALDEKGFALSTGSACSSRDNKRPVLESMGLDKETSLGGIRISQGYCTTMEEIYALTKAIAELCKIL